ncbi:hypothetical protein CSOJ01_12373 [Colletotrichum sojae]|uniref:Uncharacterized protein n=1 Tax=Colletotrichum sojae TaxID=2175907 RepID=A0A8H6MLW9_9PEZI|nr:hypothetical protein CSOJ01_12373 [Colletotrichum sojae]
MEPSPGAPRPDEQTTAGVQVNPNHDRNHREQWREVEPRQRTVEFPRRTGQAQVPPDSPHYDQDRIEQWRALVSLCQTDGQAQMPPADPDHDEDDGEDWEMVDV